MIAMLPFTYKYTSFTLCDTPPYQINDDVETLYFEWFDALNNILCQLRTYP